MENNRIKPTDNGQPRQQNIMTGAMALLASLVEEGVDTIFGYPGGSIMPIYDALYDYPGLRHILTRHEQGAIHAAQGYARATGRVGVCFATSGPGATNILTGVADAMIDSTPLVCITAQVAAKVLGSDAFQEADIISMTTPVTKWNYQVVSAEEIPAAIAKAFHIASTGRPGPVVIDITKNSQVETLDYRYEKCSGLRSYRSRTEIDTTALGHAAELLANAERPFIIAGQGVKLAGAEKVLAELSVRGDIPVAATLMGLSAIPTDHPNYVGMVGMHGNIAANRTTQHCDLLLAVGMRFSDRVTGDLNTYARQARIIHVDIDASELGRLVKPAVGIHGDAREALEALLPMVARRSRREWLECSRAWAGEESCIVERDLHPSRESLTMGETVEAINNATRGEAIIVTDVGQQQMEAARYSRFNLTRSFITSGGLGTMGYGFPAAVGAKIGRPERDVVLFAGDGGIQMTIQELGTVMEQALDVKIVIMNNSYLGMVRQWQQLFFGRRYSSTRMVNPDFVKIAEAYGIRGRRVSTRRELHEAVEEMFARREAYLLEVCIGEEDNVFPMIPAGANISDILLNE